jgi:hypothetical protein
MSQPQVKDVLTEMAELPKSGEAERKMGGIPRQTERAKGATSGGKKESPCGTYWNCVTLPLPFSLPWNCNLIATGRFSSEPRERYYYHLVSH